MLGHFARRWQNNIELYSLRDLELNTRFSSRVGFKDPFARQHNFQFHSSVNTILWALPLANLLRVFSYLA